MEAIPVAEEVCGEIDSVNLILTQGSRAASNWYL